MSHIQAPPQRKCVLGYINAHGLTASKYNTLRQKLIQDRWDALVIAETWWIPGSFDWDPWVAATSVLPPIRATGHQNHGMLLVVPPGSRAEVYALDTTQYSISFRFYGSTVKAVYLPPSLDSQPVSSTLLRAPVPHFTMGDFNIRLGQLTSDHTLSEPERIHAVFAATDRHNLLLQPATLGRPRTDHIFCQPARCDGMGLLSKPSAFRPWAHACRAANPHCSTRIRSRILTRSPDLARRLVDCTGARWRLQEAAALGSPAPRSVPEAGSNIPHQASSPTADYCYNPTPGSTVDNGNWTWQTPWDKSSKASSFRLEKPRWDTTPSAGSKEGGCPSCRHLLATIWTTLSPKEGPSGRSRGHEGVCRRPSQAQIQLSHRFRLLTKGFSKPWGRHRPLPPRTRLRAPHLDIETREGAPHPTHSSSTSSRATRRARVRVPTAYTSFS